MGLCENKVPPKSGLSDHFHHLSIIFFLKKSCHNLEESSIFTEPWPLLRPRPKPEARRKAVEIYGTWDVECEPHHFETRVDLVDFYGFQGI